MPALKDERHETFARLIAKGELPDELECYKAAGYRIPNRSEAELRAMRLRDRPDVANRIEELEALYGAGRSTQDATSPHPALDETPKDGLPDNTDGADALSLPNARQMLMKAYRLAVAAGKPGDAVRATMELAKLDGLDKAQEVVSRPFAVAINAPMDVDTWLQTFGPQLAAGETIEGLAEPIGANPPKQIVQDGPMQPLVGANPGVEGMDEHGLHAIGERLQPVEGDMTLARPLGDDEQGPWVENEGTAPPIDPGLGGFPSDGTYDPHPPVQAPPNNRVLTLDGTMDPTMQHMRIPDEFLKQQENQRQFDPNQYLEIDPFDDPEFAV